MAKEIKNIDSAKSQPKKVNKAVEAIKASRAGKFASASEFVPKNTVQDARTVGQCANPSVQEMRSVAKEKGSFKMNSVVKKITDETTSLRNLSSTKNTDSQRLSHLMLDGPDSFIDYEKLIQEGKRPFRKKPIE